MLVSLVDDLCLFVLRLGPWKCTIFSSCWPICLKTMHVLNMELHYTATACWAMWPGRPPAILGCSPESVARFSRPGWRCQVRSLPPSEWVEMPGLVHSRWEACALPWKCQPPELFASLDFPWVLCRSVFLFLWPKLKLLLLWGEHEVFCLS